MSLEPKDFRTPAAHPFGMLAGMGLSHNHECETFLAWMLIQCQERGEWAVITTQKTHPTLVSAGLLAEMGERQYQLTQKAKGLLYSHYGS